MDDSCEDQDVGNERWSQQCTPLFRVAPGPDGGRDHVDREEQSRDRGWDIDAVASLVDTRAEFTAVTPMPIRVPQIRQERREFVGPWNAIEVHVLTAG